MRFDSIRWRLALSYVILTVLTVGLVGALALTLLERYVLAQTESQLQANAGAIAKQVIPLMLPVPRTHDLQDLANSMAFLGRVRVRILDMQQNILVDSGQPEASTSVVWVQPDPRQQDNPPFLVPLSPHQSRNPGMSPWMQQNFGKRPSMVMRIVEGPWGRRVVFEAVNNNPSQADSTATIESAGSGGNSSGSSIQTAGVGAVYVRSPIGSAESPLGYVQLDSINTPGEQIMAAMRQALLIAGLSAAFVAVIAGLLVGRSLSAPILALAHSADRMSSGDLSARAPTGGAGEISHLAAQFNHMAERLQASFAALSAERDALRRFIADASHELRTPITAVGNFIELMQGAAANDPEAREEFLAESQNQVRRMEWITANLLDLSRLDAGLVQLNCQSYDLGDLLQSAASPFLARAQAIGLHLEINPPEAPIQVFCDLARMQMAIGNLLENALKFTPSGGRVTLDGERLDDKIRIRVTDTGSGIDPEELPHIFERFYRGKTTQEGSGLGLAIVQSIVQAHQGQVTVESEPGQGSRFAIFLPSQF